MSTIIKYGFEQTRDFMQLISDGYEDSLTESLAFEEWKCLAYPNMYSNPKKFKIVPWELGKEIRVAPTATEMLKIIKEHETEAQDIELNEAPERQDFLKTQLFKRILLPINTFTIKEPITIPGKLDGKDIQVPIWFNSTMKSVNVRLGFDKLDSSKPGAIPLSDLPVHMLLGGITGSGKSVALNDIICSLLLEYPPWELSLVLADFKITELSRYANRIPTPHVKIVAATSSLEFALSMFEYIIDEMNARLEVFTACGVQNLKDFREKYNLCLPRILLIADEFVQMYENVKQAEQMGNDKAEELRQRINASISAIARLGRSQGIHMLLSSQQLDGVLDDQTAGQFGAGATLAATPAVSKTLIGNQAGATLRGKGKAYVNLNKNEKEIKDNVLVRVPYISATVSEEEANAGKLTYLQELLSTMYERAKALNFQSVPYYYNENMSIPKPLYYQSLISSIKYVLNPQEGDPLADEIYKKQIFARIPLGREIAYTTEESYNLSIRYKQFNNLMIHGNDTFTKIYMTRLVGEGLSYYTNKFVLVSADEVLYKQTNLAEFAEKRSIELENILTGAIPLRYINMVATRRLLLALQNFITTKNSTGTWDDEVALEFTYNQMTGQTKPGFLDIKARLCEKYSDLAQERFKEQVKELFQDFEGSNLSFCEELIGKFVSFKTTFASLTNNFSEILGPKSFKTVVIWWLGAEAIKSNTAGDDRSKLMAFLSGSCQVGIFNVLVPALRTSTLSDISQCCNFILEHCSKEFFFDVDLPRMININKNSYGYHDRELSIHKFLRIYS